MKKHTFRFKIFLFSIITCALALQVSSQVTRQPYLQIPTPNSIVIRWQTGTGEIGNVLYGTTISALTNKVRESDDERIYHEVKMTGLIPSTKYYYSVDGSSAGNEAQYFITPPENGKATPVRIWLISDFGQTNSDQNEKRLQTIDRWKSFNNNDYHASFVMSLGDQSEDDAIYQIQHNYFSQLENVLLKTPLYTTIGNHDNHDSTLNYLKTFTLPSSGEAGGVPSGTEKYYSFDYSNIHVVVLCTEIYDQADYKAQTEWLKMDLENSKQSWLIACMHQPFHSAGYHPTDKEQSAQKRRNDWLTLLENHGVDLILQGHNHVYERSYLVDNIIGKSTDITEANKIDTGLGREDSGGPYYKPAGCIPHKGTIFITCSGGGVANSSKYYPVPYSFIPVRFPGSDYEGSVVIDIEKNRMDVKFLCNEENEKGSHIWDYFTIVKDELRTDQNTCWPAPPLSKPAYLQTVIDPTFGTKITRIVGDPGDPLPNVPGVKWAAEQLRHGYSKREAWNCDQSMIFLDRHLPNLWLNGSTYEVLFTRPDKPTNKNPDRPSYDLRWSHSEPTIMYYLLNSSDGCKFGKWDVVRDITNELIDLKPYSSCTFGAGEGNFSADGKKAAVMAVKDGKKVIFVLDVINKSKGPDIEISRADNCTMSYLGNYIVVDGFINDGDSNANSTVAGLGAEYDDDRIRVRSAVDGTLLWSESRYGLPSHWDAQIDQNGDEVVVGVAKTAPYSGNVIKRRLSDGQITVLVDTGYASHTSGRNYKRPGWVYVTYQTRDNKKSYPYQNEIVAVKLDGSRIDRLCNIRSNNFTYVAESHGSPSPDGTRVIFASDWDSGTFPVQAYVVDIRNELMPGWQKGMPQKHKEIKIH